jgi:outer membrane autotransporter protein
LNDSWMAKPYAGVRYLSIKRDSYTERMTDDVQNPLRYSGLEQETTSAVVGVRLNGRLAPKLVASLNAGFEHDLHHSIDDYRATGVDDLGSIDMNSQKDRTRPTAGLGIAYDIADKQRLSANVQYRKEIFMSESSTTGQVTYTIGF